MRILYLCKRQYMGHDVIVDRYARLYEQPYQLSQLGNDILGVCLSYRSCSVKDEVHPTEHGSLRWIGLSSGVSRFSILSYPTELLKIVRQFKPDLIVGASDSLHIILGAWISKKLRITYAIDLYDDFESFGLTKIPFVKHFYRKALKTATVITCVSQSLCDYVKPHTRTNATILAIPSTIDRSVFHPRNKIEMRIKFNLPQNIPIIGTAGGLYKNKGIDIVYNAIVNIIEHFPDSLCILAGPFDKNFPPPQHKRIIYLGKLPHDKIADFFCALDVGIIYIKNTQYGRHSFPQKAYEMAACKIPIVAADVGDIKHIFSHYNNELYFADDPNSLSQAVLNQLEYPHINNIQIENWFELASKMFSAYNFAHKSCLQ